MHQQLIKSRNERRISQRGYLNEDILFRQLNVGRKTVIQLVVQKALQMELLQWCYDCFTSGHLALNKTYKRLVNIFLEQHVCQFHCTKNEVFHYRFFQ